MPPQTTPETDRTFILENRKDEPENAQFTRSFGPRIPNEVMKEGQTLEVIQETAKALHGKISGSTEPENAQGNLLSSSSTIEDDVAVDMLTHQSGISSTGVYRLFFNSQVEPSLMLVGARPHSFN